MSSVTELGRGTSRLDELAKRLSLVGTNRRITPDAAFQSARAVLAFEPQIEGRNLDEISKPIVEGFIKDLVTWRYTLFTSPPGTHLKSDWQGEANRLKTKLQGRRGNTREKWEIRARLLVVDPNYCIEWIDYTLQKLGK